MGRNDKNFISCWRHFLAYTTSTTQPHEHSRIIPLTTSSVRRPRDSNWVSTIRAIVHSIQFCPRLQKSQTRRLSLTYQVSSSFAPSLHLLCNSKQLLPRSPTHPGTWAAGCLPALICPDCPAAFGKENPLLILNILLTYNVYYSLDFFSILLLPLKHDADLWFGMLGYTPPKLKDLLLQNYSSHL